MTYSKFKKITYFELSFAWFNLIIFFQPYNPKWIGKSFKTTALAVDGVVEAIEYIDPLYFIVGVHFHPEWDDDNLIFKRLIKEGEKRLER